MNREAGKTGKDEAGSSRTLSELPIKMNFGFGSEIHGRGSGGVAGVMTADLYPFAVALKHKNP